MIKTKKQRGGLCLLLGIILITPACSGMMLSSGSEQVIAFVDVNLIPMTEEVVLKHQTVLVEGTEIIGIGPSDDIQVPRNALVIDGFGRYLLPGLADMHMHTREEWEDPDLWPVHPLKLYLANGVTTIRDFAPAGSRLTYALDWREEIKAGLRDGPKIITSGQLLYASPLEDPEVIVQMNADLGFDFIKFYSYLSKDDFQRGMQQAKQVGIYTAGHIPFAVGLDGALEEGMDEIAHVEELVYEFIDFDRQQALFPDDWWEEVISGAIRTFEVEDDDFLQHFSEDNEANLDSITMMLLDSGTPVVTTMIIDRVVIQKNFQKGVFLTKLENVYFKQGYLDRYLAGDEKHLDQCRGLEAFCAAKAGLDSWILTGLNEAGVLLVLGTDAGTGGMGIVPGFSVHEEFEILIENGLTPYQALECATVNPGIVAARMGGADDFGTIEVGKRADLLLVDDNPVTDLATLRTPVGVMAAGEWHSRADLQDFLEINE
jgi:imidazolonepropionase-like amidohydrolase